MKLPSRRQEELLRAMEEHGPLPDYYNRSTTNALLRNGWVELLTRRQARDGAVLSSKLAITTRGRWALRHLDAAWVA